MLHGCPECGANDWCLLLGFVALGTLLDQDGTIKLEVNDITQLDDTIESMECNKCGAVFERPCGDIFKEYVFPPVVVSVMGGCADVESNPTYSYVEIRDYDEHGSDKEYASRVY
jgi:hypothetical protein